MKASEMKENQGKSIKSQFNATTSLVPSSYLRLIDTSSDDCNHNDMLVYNDE